MFIGISTSNSFYKSLCGRTLGAVTLLHSGQVVGGGKEWWCHTGDHLIIVRYKNGTLVMGVGESEYEATINVKMIATEDSEKFNINFSEIKEYMNWIYDDDVCLGES